jgi:hypothetical protein
MATRDDPARSTPLGFVRYASEFYQAARTVDDTIGHKRGYEIVAPIPALFLIGQSIELSLKAFLLHKGVSLRDLRSTYGHELRRALKKAKELGVHSSITLSRNDEGLLGILDELYSTKQLQYTVTGMKTFPSYGELERIAQRLLEAIGPVVGFPVERMPHAL